LMSLSRKLYIIYSQGHQIKLMPINQANNFH